MRRLVCALVLLGCGGSEGRKDGGTPDGAPQPVTFGEWKVAGAPVVADAPGRVTLVYEGAPERRALGVATLVGGAYRLVPAIDPAFEDGRMPVGVEPAGTYVPVVPLAAAPARTRVWRAIAGVSMGGGAAAAIGLRSPDRWDLVADLGGEPGPSTAYTLGMFAEYLMGGFCPDGGLCLDAQRPPYAGQYELRADFEHFVYQAGAGVGLTLNRRLYVRATRDLSRALGNPALYNPASAYLPPGVTDAWLANPARCDEPVVLERFFDRRFNPDGALPVITFCDGGDGPRLGLGVFDPELPQTESFEVLLAVDRNRNGRRDAGEPVLMQPSEPWTDDGPGGEYHPLRNPTGQTKNLTRDEGEAFLDVGLDGVAGTCQAPEPGCWDHGEGDGLWTVNPGLERWLANDAARNLAAMTAAQRARIAIYADAGMRDFLNSHVATSAMVGSMAALGMPVTMWNGFPRLGGVTSESLYDFEKVPWVDLPDHVFVRYGDPAASQAQIEAGDGRHAGSPPQLIARITTMFAWIDARWEDGDRARAEGTSMDYLADQRFTSPSTGRETPYAVFLPPGYAAGASRYPVVYFMHGYGQGPDDLLAPVGLLSGFMAEGRLQKMIVVFVDGRCREGDGCETGTFFMNSPVHPKAQMETHLYELRDEVDRRFRTR